MKPTVADRLNIMIRRMCEEPKLSHDRDYRKAFFHYVHKLPEEQRPSFIGQYAIIFRETPDPIDRTLPKMGISSEDI